MFLWRNRIKMEQIIHNNCLTAWTCIKGELYIGGRRKSKSLTCVMAQYVAHLSSVSECLVFLAGRLISFRASKQFQTLGT